MDLGPARLHELLCSGRGVVLDPDDSCAEAATPWLDRVGRVGWWASAAPMLIRPDGCVCWASAAPEALRLSLARWFGAPKPTATPTTRLRGR
ncbi:hypothetical protein P3T36_001689 [Kitasatospora sp. MAP12-15]|uniref:aromatic-ring hydroxylase C-terminal domain-containing protein n=1 Tax=unclassified Kitasatospora TaxID=2633591 RepID=UPI00247BF4BE|nr:hypothetical protein [Kitasatospora sp. MAP12-44]